MSEKLNCELHDTSSDAFKRQVLRHVTGLRLLPGLRVEAEPGGAAECARLIVGGQCSQFEYICPTDIPGADFEIRSRATTQ